MKTARWIAKKRNAIAVRNDGMPLIQSDVNNVSVLMELRCDKAAFLRVPLLSPAVCHFLLIIVDLNAPHDLDSSRCT